MARTRETIGLKTLRQERGSTQAELAERAGWKQETVSRLERQLVDTKLSTLRRYVESLGGELRLVAVFKGVEKNVDFGRS